MVLELNTTDKTVTIKDESYKFEDLQKVMFLIGIIDWKIIKECHLAEVGFRDISCDPVFYEGTKTYSDIRCATLTDGTNTYIK